MATKTRSRSERDTGPRPKNDAYTGLLVIALLAMITSCVLWYVDFDSYGKTAPPKVNIPAPNSSTPPPIPTAPPAGETPPAPMGETPMPMPMPMDTNPMPMPMKPMDPMPMKPMDPMQPNPVQPKGM